MREHVIRLVSRTGELRHTHCPFSDHEWDHDKSESRMFCEFTKSDCRYGLTEIRVPQDCPLKRGIVRVRLELGEDF